MYGDCPCKTVLIGYFERKVVLLFVIIGYERAEQEENVSENVGSAQTQLVVEHRLPFQESWNRLQEV